MPTEEEFEQYKAVIYAKYLSILSVYRTEDGLKLYLEDPGHGIVQNVFYNG